MKKFRFVRIACAFLLCCLVLAQFGGIAANATEACTHNNAQVIPAVPATCSEPGYTEGVKCPDCGVTLAEPRQTDKLPHTPEVIPSKAATCTEAGHTEGVKCSVCGEILTEPRLTEKLPHTEQAVPGKAATCAAAGLTEGKKCSVCGEVLVAQKEIPAKSHVEKVIPATAGDCQHPGLTEGIVCQVCGATLKAQQSTGAGDHVMENGKCKICGYVKPVAGPTPGLDNVPMTGDITGQVVLSAMAVAAVISMLAAAAFAGKRGMAK